MELVALAQWITLYNGVVFALYAWDKWCAKRGYWRVPERTLLGFALCGGAPGALLGIHLLRHKTRKPIFKVGVPVMLVLQVALALWWLSR